MEGRFQKLGIYQVSAGSAGENQPQLLASLDKMIGDPNAWVREAAAEAMGRLGKALPEPVFDRLDTLSADPDIWVRRKVAEALALIGDKSPEKALLLLDKLANDPNRAVAEFAKQMTRNLKKKLKPASSL